MSLETIFWGLVVIAVLETIIIGIKRYSNYVNSEMLYKPKPLTQEDLAEKIAFFAKNEFDKNSVNEKLLSDENIGKHFKRNWKQITSDMYFIMGEQRLKDIFGLKKLPKPRPGFAAHFFFFIFSLIIGLFGIAPETPMNREERNNIIGVFRSFYISLLHQFYTQFKNQVEVYEFVEFEDEEY